ncbi:antifreeze protein [Pelagovum pacificum]|uniref:Antifreeze protein n=1 Tax=Pelagovum pacificum TaxID=2588711 RepID=A0A5C5GCK4_9RHOB|nr:antifreeze protein [Pelagovum pacificum]QQA42234.1 antifreeze protein [Pelagovum pacificum]TNY31319.1 antifreeze protein [Pelagovum pacificum]
MRPTLFMSPADCIRLSTACWRLWVDAQSVVAHRMFGFAMLERSSPSEIGRMLAEKPAAFGEAALAATQAVMAGKRPDQIALAAMAPVERRAHGNARRLDKRGRS